MRQLLVVTALLVGGAGTTSAQLAVSQATEKLLVLPMMASSADSAASIALADAVRDRLTQSAKRWVLVIPKAKLCEALRASGFPCDGLLDDQQARQLARFLTVQAYVTGFFERKGAEMKANVRLIDIASSGMSATFTATNGNPGTTAALADAIVQRITTVIRASEPTRECTTERQRGQFARALSAARKAIALDPNATGAHLCIATVYEAQRMPVDSNIAASQRALKGDSCNGTAWENIARGYQQKGDTLKAVDAFVGGLACEPRNTTRRLAIAQLLRQMKQYQRAVDVLDEGLAVVPHEAQLIELKNRICIEGELWRCALTAIDQKVAVDSAPLDDSMLVKTAIAAAEQVSDTLATVRYARAGARHFPRSTYFLKKLGSAFETAGKPDSAIIYYRQALAIDPSDVSTSLLVAKAIIDRAVWDTAVSKGDTVALRRLRNAYADRLDSARTYLRPGLASNDSTQKLSAAVIMLTGGSKLAQAGAYDRAYPWLDTLLHLVAPRAPADTLGPRFQVRINGSFWYGLSSVLTLAKPYKDMTEMKGNGPERCDAARAVFDRLTRTRSALLLGRRVHPPTADQMLGYVSQYEKAKPQVQRAFKCRPPLN